MKRIVTMQDFSCIGKCSLTAAIPVLSAMGVECAAVPTALLSAHTRFPGYTSLNLAPAAGKILDHWQAMAVRFDGIYTGYLANPAQCRLALSLIRRFRQEGTLVLVDPAMGDGGALYDGFAPDFPAQMARVCAEADLILPNVTEACLLTGTEWREHWSQAELRLLLKRLLELGCGAAVVTGAALTPDAMTIAGLSRDGTSFLCSNPRLPGTYHGTGDLFAAACMGAAIRGAPLGRALQLAADYVLACIRATIAAPDARWYGVEFESQTGTLLTLLDHALTQPEPLRPEPPCSKPAPPAHSLADDR